MNETIEHHANANQFLLEQGQDNQEEPNENDDDESLLNDLPAQAIAHLTAALRRVLVRSAESPELLDFTVALLRRVAFGGAGNDDMDDKGDDDDDDNDDDRTMAGAFVITNALTVMAFAHQDGHPVALMTQGRKDLAADVKDRHFSETTEPCVI